MTPRECAMIEKISLYLGAVGLSGYVLSVDGQAAFAMALAVIGAGAGLGQLIGARMAKT